jgi:hypothetical protein
MYMIINALNLAVLVPSGGVERASDGPACRAELEGLNLRTTVELPTGLLIEGPWRVQHGGDMQNGETHFVLVATLDRVIERDVMTGERRVTPFPEPVSMMFEGTDQRTLVQRAANVWCVTVMRAQENQALDRIPANHGSITRIAVLTEPRSRG